MAAETWPMTADRLSVILVGAVLRRIVRAGVSAPWDRLDNDAVAFAVLRAGTLIAGVAALFIVPIQPEHQIHLAPFLGGFIVYNVALLIVLTRWADEARAVFVGTLAADLALVFLLIWFTGGGRSHFFPLLYLLVALNAYYFGPGIGVLAAGLAFGLLGAANWLTVPSASWFDLGARTILLGILAIALGYVADRERAARARAERLNREMEAATARLARVEQLAAVGRLSAKMAHEVRNPLGAINLNVDMLGDLVRDLAGPSSGEAKDLLRGIQTEVRGLAAVAEEYLIAARLPRPRREKESVNDVVVEVIGFMRPVAELHHVTIGMALGPRLPLLAFDRPMLRQAVRNLIKNSIEALSDGGRITVATSLDGQEALISVEDDGPGFTEEMRTRLSEPFFTTKPGGTGLGLSITQEIARAHGGELTWSGQPGGGACFTMRLPVDRGDDD